jgi:SAM-dependent methyltransferase
MAAAARPDVWASGDAYEPYVGRWSRLVARKFIDWLSIPAHRDWLDVGCGTGALTEIILEKANPRRVHGVDPSEGFVNYSSHHVRDARATFQVGDARDLPVDEATFDSVVSGLVINFVPDQIRAITAMRKAARAGGAVAAYVWDYAGEMQMMRRFWDAAVALNPTARDLDEGSRFPTCHPDPLRKLFQTAGLHEVAVEAIDVPTVFKDFDDYWTPFLGGQAPAPGYCMSLSDDTRTALRERIRQSLPINSNGSINLIARAWAAKGIKIE